MTKVQNSAYLAKVKPLLKKLLNKLLEAYPYASILACDCKSRVYSVSKNGISISDNAMLGNRGFCVKVYDGISYAEYSFTSISESEIDKIVNKINDELVPMTDILPSLFTNEKITALTDEEENFSASTEFEINPVDFPESEIIAKLTAITKKGYAYSDKILASNANYNWQMYSKLFLSKNKDMEQNVMWGAASANIMTPKGEEVAYSYVSKSGLGGLEILEQLEARIEIAAKNALDLATSEPIVPGEYECICTPDVTGMIVHEAFGHGVEMDMFVKDRALAKQYVGKQVASPLVTMRDGAAAYQEVASFFFDDDGVIAKDTVIIKDGILERGISDSLSAARLGTEPTANGRRESFARKGYTRMTNTYFEAGTDKVEDMIKSIENGFLLDVPFSGMEDPKNWGIQCMVSIAREIKNGELTGKIYSPIVLTGYVPDLLKSITMMSDKIELSGGGFCGKGWKEWVKVSDGGPYIKAKIRLG